MLYIEISKEIKEQQQYAAIKQTTIITVWKQGESKHFWCFMFFFFDLRMCFSRRYFCDDAHSAQMSAGYTYITLFWHLTTSEPINMLAHVINYGEKNCPILTMVRIYDRLKNC